MDSRGPVFYRQMRIGKGGQPFRIIKFRSMDAVSSVSPPGITVAGDKRITRVGSILRRYKIDELPQLWNVFRGDMSLVGPRPELSKYVETYSLEQRQVLSLRPGITDPATLAYRHEEEILSHSANPDEFYSTRILPDKLHHNLAYVRTISLAGDLQILFRTVFVSFIAVQSNLGKMNPSAAENQSQGPDSTRAIAERR